MTQLSLKWLFFCLRIAKKFQEHDILTFSLLHVNNQDLILTLHICTAGSIKVALGLGNWATVNISYCLVVTQGNHCIVWYAQMPSSQPSLNQLYIYLQCSFWRSDNHKLQMTSSIFIDCILQQNLPIISCPYKKICLMHKNPQRCKMIIFMACTPMDAKIRKKSEHVHLWKYPVCVFCGSYYGCCWRMHISFSL